MVMHIWNRSLVTLPLKFGALPLTTPTLPLHMKPLHMQSAPSLTAKTQFLKISSTTSRSDHLAKTSLLTLSCAEHTTRSGWPVMS